MTSSPNLAEIGGHAARLRRVRAEKIAQGKAAMVVYIPTDILQVIDAEKAEHGLAGRAEAVARMMAELQTLRSGEGEDRA